MTATVLRLVGVTQQYGSGETAVSALSGVDLTDQEVGVTLVAWLVPPRHPDLTRRTAIA
ncbi:hypothetical protein [Microbacterium sp. C7(2022)]|uniref:hypothetical protein n=1 Tax=Microbacterium sp. C7(2022) TaxID=2992759 RepID=UPI00237BAC2B|nr:hypothetical protein [Microbacterium sp. C7(2022)]MDE0547293.1 hypothetical protein [Microbacterium sp. C7(2022)]